MTDKKTIPLKDYFCTIFSIILGSTLTLGTTYLTSTHQEKIALTDKRAEIIHEVAAVLAKAGRVRALWMIHSVNSAAARDISQVCITSILHGEKSDNCDITTMNDNIDKYNKEIFDVTSEFLAAKSSSIAYFCDKTVDTLERLDQQNFWWDGDKKVSLSS